LGWFLGLFNRGLEATTKGYSALTRVMVRTVIGGLIFRWFRDRRKGRKPKAPRTPPSSDS